MVSNQKIMRCKIWLWASVYSLLFVFQGVRSFGQEDFRYYDRITYQLYQDGAWSELAREGKEGLRHDLDYYYLRMRLGIAFYALEKYQGAVPHFRKALRFDPSSTAAREYLVNSLIMSGRPQAARMFVSAENAREGLALPSPWAVSAFFSYKASDDRTDVGDLRYVSLGLRHGLGKRLLWDHRFSQLNQYFSDSTLVSNPSNPGPGPGPDVEHETWEETRRSMVQWEYQWVGNLVLSHALEAEGGFNYLWGEGADLTFHEWGSRLGVIFFAPGVRLAARGGVSRFGDSTQTQFNVQAHYYPRQNTRTYFRVGATAKHQGTAWDHWLEGGFGWRIMANTWLEITGEQGKINYFQDWGLDATYNLPDPMRWRLGGNLQYWLKGRHLLYFRYHWEEKDRYLTGVSFRHQQFIAGIQWNI